MSSADDMEINGRNGMSKMRSHQSGAVVVYMAVMAAVLAMMVLFVYNTGHIANEKTRLQNTTDAAAHSVAMLQSRDLNFQAYMNRSMIANQVAVAQAISLVSWTRFLDNVIQNLRKYTSWVPYWGAVINVMARISPIVKTGAEQGGRFFVSGEDTIISGFSEAQRIMHNTVIVEIPLTMQQVVRANDPGVSTGLITNSTLLKQLITTYSGAISRYDPENVKNRSGNNWREDKIRMDEFRDVTLRSRDGFSTSRTYTLLKPPIPQPLPQFKLERAGGTELISGNSNAPYYTWAGMDTLSLHTRTWRNGLSPGYRSWKEQWPPLGWGAAQTGDTIYYVNFRGNNFGSTWRINPRSSGMAAAQFQNASKVGTFSGLRTFSDITQKGLLDTMPAAVILLSKPQGGNTGVRTARDIGFAKAGTSVDLEQPGGMSNNRLHAMAKAEAYFSRPDDLWSRGKQGGREYGNVYNPFWQPRLTKLTASERVMVIGLANIH